MPPSVAGTNHHPHAVPMQRMQNWQLTYDERCCHTDGEIESKNARDETWHATCIT